MNEKELAAHLARCRQVANKRRWLPQELAELRQFVKVGLTSRYIFRAKLLPGRSESSIGNKISEIRDGVV